MPLDVASVERILVYLSVAKTNRQNVRAVQHQTARRFKFRRKALWWLCAKLVLIISWSHLSGGKSKSARLAKYTMSITLKVDISVCTYH